MTLEEGNKIISEFMGFKRTTEKRFIEYVTHFPDNSIMPKYCVLKKKTMEQKRDNFLISFHSDWNWLMPAWGKIGNAVFKIRHKVDSSEYLIASVITQHIIESLRKPDINTAFLWIVELINWYNSNNPQPTMSDNKTIPSASEFLSKETFVDEKHRVLISIDIAEKKTNELIRLHLEAIANEIAENAELDCDEGSDDNGISVDKHSILKIATDYISKIK